MKNAYKCNLGGFTLIELLVVVLIIGILAAVAVPQYQKAVMKARYSQAMILVDSVARAQQVYFMANGKYATVFEDLDTELPTGEIRANGQRIKYGWGECVLQGTSVQEITEVFCYVAGNLSLIYLRHLRSGSRYCRYHPAGDPNKIGEKVCSSFGGTKSVNEEFVQYLLN